jgi:hypothetical protein
VADSLRHDHVGLEPRLRNSRNPAKPVNRNGV